MKGKKMNDGLRRGLRSRGLRCWAAALGVTCCVLLWGCVKDQDGCPSGGGEGSGVPVTMSFTSEGPLHAVDKDALKACSAAAPGSGTASAAVSAAGVAAKSSGTVPAPAGVSARGVLNPSMVDEWAVTDMWVLQYDMSGGANGALAVRRYISSVVQDGATVRVTTDLEPMEKARIVVLANAPGFLSESDLPTGSTLADLAALTFGINAASGSALPEEYSPALPMRAESSDMKLETGQTATVRMPLYRLVSKVNFTVDNRCAEGYPRLTLTSVALRNVPAVGCYARVVESTHASVRYPAAALANFKDYDYLLDGIGAQNEFLWYMAPNSRGVGSGTVPADKTAVNAPAGEGDYCTYAYVQGMMEQSEGGPLIPMSYRVYLGGNATNDYNVWANEAYRIRMTISALPDAPDVEVGHDGFTIELAGPDGSHANTVEGWEILVEGATVAPDPSAGIDYKSRNFTFTVFGSFSGKLPVRIVSGGTVLASGNASKGTGVQLTLPENTSEGARTVSFEYNPGSWTAIKSATQAGKPGDLIDAGNLWVDRYERTMVDWYEAKSWCEGRGMRLPSDFSECRSIIVRRNELGLVLTGGAYWCRAESNYGGGGNRCAAGVNPDELNSNWVYWKHIPTGFVFCVKDK